MKIPVYEIKKLTPTNQNQYEEFCDIINLPSLKHGYIEVIDNSIMDINKAQFKKLLKVSSSIYDYNDKKYLDGYIVFMDNAIKLFVKK